MSEPSSDARWAALLPREPPAVAAPPSDPWWRPGPSAFAFVATMALLGALTRLRLFVPSSLSLGAREEVRVLTPLLLASVALAHAIAAALAARVRRAPLAVAALLLVTAALPLLAELLRPALHVALSEAAPHYCEAAPRSCPPGAWPWWAGALIGASLAPLVVAAVRTRAQRALDGAARMLFLTGTWTGVVTIALRLAHITGDEALAFAAAVAAGCAVLGVADTALRWLRLSTLLRARRLSVSPARADDPDDLRPYASVPEGVDVDDVLRLDEAREGSPYRAVRLGRPLGRSPRDVAVLVRALATRGRRQLVGLVVVFGALAAATAFGHGPAIEDPTGWSVVTSP